MSRKIKLAIFFLTLLLVWSFVAPFLAMNLVVGKPLEKADAILVLSGSSEYVERTREAARLFRQGIAPRIFLTNDGGQGGWDKKEQRNPYFYEKARWELLAQGVPESAIEVLPEIVEGTNEEAVLFSKIVRERNFKSVLLVTSAYHTRRTLRTFETVLHESNEAVEIGIAAPETASHFYWWLKPKGWKSVAGEYLKIAYYWAFY